MLLRAISTDPKAVDVTSYHGRRDLLLDMRTELEKCQKSIAEYLDVKKKIFPRFCFVSNDSLLDILSNGNEPTRVVPHLFECFAGIHDLEFEETGLQAKTKT